MNKCRLMFLRSDYSRNLRTLVAQESPYNSTDTLLLTATFVLSRNIGKKRSRDRDVRQRIHTRQQDDSHVRNAVDDGLSVQPVQSCCQICQYAYDAPTTPDLQCCWTYDQLQDEIVNCRREQPPDASSSYALLLVDTRIARQSTTYCTSKQHQIFPNLLQASKTACLLPPDQQTPPLVAAAVSKLRRPSHQSMTTTTTTMSPSEPAYQMRKILLESRRSCHSSHHR